MQITVLGGHPVEPTAKSIPAEVLHPYPISDRQAKTLLELTALAYEHLTSAQFANKNSGPLQ